MCKKILFLISVISSFASYAQVGINTITPATNLALKVDGVLNSATIDDDVVITKTGNVGVAVSLPTNALEIKATSPLKALQLSSPNMGAGKYLVSDGSGFGTWQSIPLESLNKTTLVIGDLANTDVNITQTTSDAATTYTGVSINLPNGSWEIFVNFYLENNENLNYTTMSTNTFWLRTYFSNGISVFGFSNIGVNTAAGTYYGLSLAPLTSDYINGNSRNFLVSNEIYGPSSNAESKRMMAFQGRVLIRNTSGANKRYYMFTKETTGGAIALNRFGSKNVDGNLIYALPYKEN